MSALIPAALEALPVVENGVEHLIAWIEAERAAGQQSGEWTAAYESKFLEAMIARAKTANYQPDKV